MPIHLLLYPKPLHIELDALYHEEQYGDFNEFLLDILKEHVNQRTTNVPSDETRLRNIERRMTQIETTKHTEPTPKPISATKPSIQELDLAALESLDDEQLERFARQYGITGSIDEIFLKFKQQVMTDGKEKNTHENKGKTSIDEK